MNYVAKIKLSNVKCGGCFSSISQMIYLEDIIHLDMDHINKVATIRYENDHSIVKNIVDRINQSKFKVELIFEEIE